MKIQSVSGYSYGVVGTIFLILSTYIEFKGCKTGLSAGFLILTSFLFLFQLNKLTIPYNFIHNTKTLHT